MYEDLSPEQDCPFCISILAETVQHRHRHRSKQLREFNHLHHRTFASIIVARRAFYTLSPVALVCGNGWHGSFFRSLSFIISRP